MSYEFYFLLDSAVVKRPNPIKIDEAERAYLRKAKYLNIPLADTVEELRRIRGLASNPEGWDEARLAAARKHNAVQWLERMNFAYELQVKQKKIEKESVYHRVMLKQSTLCVSNEHVISVTLFDKGCAAMFKLTWHDHCV